MAFYKTLSAVTIILLVLIFSSNVFSMDFVGDDIIDSSPKYPSFSEREDIETKKLISKKEKSCSHWGLSHWFSGITEYFERCCCCGVSEDNERAFVLTRGGDIAQSSDCFILGVTQLGTCCCDNPVGGTLCCPLATAVHLCCLPFVCCGCSNSTYRSSAPTREETDAIARGVKQMLEEDQQRRNAEDNTPQGKERLRKAKEQEELNRREYIIREHTIYSGDQPHIVSQKRNFRPFEYSYPDEK